MRHILMAIAFAATLGHILFLVSATYVNWSAKTAKSVELAILWYVFAAILALISLGVDLAYSSPATCVLDLGKLLITVSCIAVAASKLERMPKAKVKVNPIDDAIRQFELEHEREVAKLQAKALKELQEEYPLPKDELKRKYRYPL